MAYAKKSLGQNFLKSKQAIRRIIESARLGQTDVVLEIGPGRGALTAPLLEHAGKVVAIEKDRELIPILQETFAKEITDGRLILIEGDILEMDVNGVRPHFGSSSTYKLVANIPYYITGAIIRRFLETPFPPQLMVLMLQKEVARRIVAQDKKESLLSLSVKAYGKPKYIETVHAKYFSPQPKVDSAILLIDSITRDYFRTISEAHYFAVLHAAFAHKRKVLISNLSNEFPKEKVAQAFVQLNLSKNIRAEDVLQEQWVMLCEFLS